MQKLETSLKKLQDKWLEELNENLDFDITKSFIADFKEQNPGFLIEDVNQLILLQANRYILNDLIEEGIKTFTKAVSDSFQEVILASCIFLSKDNKIYENINLYMCLDIIQKIKPSTSNILMHKKWIAANNVIQKVILRQIKINKADI